MNLFVQLPPHSDGAPRGVIRPILLVVQDISTRKILGWRLGESESAELILSALAQVLLVGVPDVLHIDNTRAMSARWLVGEVARRRFGRPAAGDDAGDVFAGVIGELGIKVSHTGLIQTLAKTPSGARRHRGRGQAKPVERVFQLLDDRIARHPAFAGHYTGSSVGTKPENYNEGVAGVAWAEVEAVAAEVIAEYNAATDRRAEPLVAAGGVSADVLFARQIAAKPPRPATAEDFDALLLPGETTKIKKDGTFSLKAGAGEGFGRNRYHAEQLLEYAGRNLLVRYDPTRLHAPVIVSDGRGRRICRAVVQVAAGFGDSAAAAIHNRERRRWVKATLAAKRAEERMNNNERQEIARIAAGRSATAADGELPPVLRIGKTARKEKLTQPSATPTDLAAAYRRYQEGS